MATFVGSLMTHDELLAVALRRGIVVWERSQKVETLFKGRKGAKNVCARNIITGEVHPIFPRTNHFCRELAGSEMIRGHQLLP